jgi:short-subunit dehydrogenase
MAGSMTGKTALVTGASSGIGEWLAREHAQRGGDLVLVARRGERLEALAAELREGHGIEVTVIAMDLGVPGAAEQLMQACDDANLQIDVLINNAGFGGHGRFVERGLDKDLQMMQLNMVALTELTYHCLQGMVERGEGRVLNVGSTAGFLPGPLQAVYYATKAFVNSFSQAIAQELKGTGVTVTVLCPGPVATEFVEAADLDGLSAFKSAPGPESVARKGYGWRAQACSGMMRALTERWPSGRRRTPGKCVYGNVSRVRIPPSPPHASWS